MIEFLNFLNPSTGFFILEKDLFIGCILKKLKNYFFSDGQINFIKWHVLIVFLQESYIILKRDHVLVSSKQLQWGRYKTKRRQEWVY